MKSFITRNSASVSRSVSAAVGSSIMRILASKDSALAISTICCVATVRSPTFASGFRLSPTRSRRALVSSRIFLGDRLNRVPENCSRPKKMFCSTVRSGMRLSS